MGSKVDYTYVGASSIISSLGFTTGENVANLWALKSGIRTLEDKSVLENSLSAAKIDIERLSEVLNDKKLVGFTILEKLFIITLQDVISHSGIDITDARSGLIISTTKGNIDHLNPLEDLDERVHLWKMAQRIAAFFGVKSEPLLVSNACISGVSSIIVASRLIRQGKFDNIIVAGGDLLTRFVASGFAAFKSLSSQPCRPYDIARDGLSLGEGCASLLITSDYNLSDGVVVEGGAITNDANHISGPSRTGDGLFLAMQQAMLESNLCEDDISFVNAHGTATLFNDEMESKAIKLAKLDSTYVNSLKPYFGHTLGAAGLIESIICIEQLKCSTAFATMGFKELGTTEKIDVAGAHQQINMSRCLKTASGFGGCNAAVVFALDCFKQKLNQAGIRDFTNVAHCKIHKGELLVNGEVLYSSDEEYEAFIRSIYKQHCIPNLKFYKMDDLCKLGYVAAECLLKGRSFKPIEVAIVMGNSSSSLDTDWKHQHLIDEQGEANASPAIFVYTLPNVVLGEICIRHKLQGENTFFIKGENSKFIEEYAHSLLQEGRYKAAIYGWCEFYKNNYEADFKLIERK